jgi:hypothetical protein
MSYSHANLRGNIVSLTEGFTLSPSDEGKLFRCENTANIVITVPGTLPEGFNCGFIMWSTGTITLTPTVGVVNRSGKTALTTQYQSGSLMVIKFMGHAKHDFLVGGDFA